MVADLISNEAVVCIIGLGYVGLPLAQAFSKSHRVVGFDIDPVKIAGLKENSHNQNILFTTRAEDIEPSAFFIICVPTPVTRAKEVDLSFIESAARTAGQRMKKGSMVILESTVYPGLTEEIVKPILEKESRMKCGADFKIGYSPERINPGDDKHTVENTTKIVAGMDEEATEVLAELYGCVTNSIFMARDIRTAEAAKLVENIQRDMNIALMNELSAAFEKMGLNTRDVLKAAETKWNFHRYYPGLVGGYCIPVNPYYMVHKAEQVGYHARFILAGRETNESVPKRIARMMIEALKKTGKAPEGSTALILGLTYKADVSDLRESATKELVKELADNGVLVMGFDPNVDEENFKHNWEDEFALKMVRDICDTKQLKVDGVILTVAHSAFRDVSLSDLKSLQNESPILIDVPACYSAQEAKQAGLYYKTL